jgi:glycosyltransferase involved in cell wall biosynthesis
MILSILICTLEKRAVMFNSLIQKLKSQINDEVEILFDCDNGEKIIGKKRNDLLQRATGDFVVFIDDDDEISEDYVYLILNAIKKNPDVDCIGIQGVISFDGQNECQWYISKDYGRWYEENHIYYRTPNHISPVRTELAKQIGFLELNFSEDSDYSQRLFPLLNKEAKVEKNIYNYKFVANK